MNSCNTLVRWGMEFRLGSAPYSVCRPVIQGDKTRFKALLWLASMAGFTATSTLRLPSSGLISCQLPAAVPIRRLLQPQASVLGQRFGLLGRAVALQVIG